MYSSQKLRALFAILSVLIFGLVIFLFIRYENSLCMGVSVVSSERFNDYSESYDFDITQLTFNKEKIAADIKSNTIYISQPENALTSFSNLEGSIDTEANCSLYFSDDTALNNINESVRAGTPLSLLVINGKSYKQVNVIITTLPVLNMNGEITGIDDQERELYYGDLTLWCGSSPTSGSYSVQSSKVQWHIRGRSSATKSKKPWKLSLKNSDGEKKNCDLLGAGSDDDWILNPMNVDDTKVREKFTMDLWKELSNETEKTYQMSQGEYTEVIINGEYRGLYLLQRRIDEKYLNLDRNKDILLKGTFVWSADTVQDAYEIIYSPYSENQTYNIISQMVNENIYFEISLQNFIDVNLLLDYCLAYDNTSFINMFFVLHETDNSYEVHLVPWDTDISFGVFWDNKFVYNYEESIKKHAYRAELPLMKDQYPELCDMLKSRWNELRSSVFTENIINGILDNNIRMITESGAFERDQAKWGTFYNGKDLQNNIYTFSEEHLAFLDEYYNN